MQYVISYVPRIALGGGRLKVISYTTPIIKIGAFDWIIVVEKSESRKLGRRRIYPLWRRSDGSEEGGFPVEWRDMASWSYFNPRDSKNLGLPRALRKGYRKYHDSIVEHAKPKARVFRFFSQRKSGSVLYSR